MQKEKGNLAECLHKYSMESLTAYSDTFDVKMEKGMTQDDLCEALARELIRRNVLEQRLGILDDQALEVLSDLRKGRKSEESDVLDELDGLDLIYGNDEENLWIIPSEVISAMDVLSDEDWNLRRRQRVWLMKCMVVVSHYWGDAPVSQMMELFKDRKEIDGSHADLKALYREIPVSELSCIMIGDSFVVRGFRTSEVFAAYRERQKKVPYYVPSVEEIEDLYENDCDTQEAYTKKVSAWFAQLGMEEGNLGMFVHEVWNDISYGHAESEVQSTARRFVNFDSHEEEEAFRQMIHDWYMHTRRFEYRGNTALEVLNLRKN
jgi:hypothetical protein